MAAALPLTALVPPPDPGRGAVRRVRIALAGGARTTAYVLVRESTDTEVRVAVLRGQQRLEPYCARRGVEDAIVGGFFTRAEKLPLGEVRTRGVARRHVSFLAPHDAVRACVHVAGGQLQIALRDELGPAPRGDLLQAGPLLVRDGAVVYERSNDPEGFSAGAIQFDSDITLGRHPRAALGITGAGRLLAVVCDGRSRADAGLTLEELAALLAGLGARDALNLDGGGSTSLVAGGRLRNRPRGGWERAEPGGRPVSTALLLVPAADTGLPGLVQAAGRYVQALITGPSHLPKVLMALQFFPRGGSAHVARNLARALPQAGWEATVLSGSARPDGDACAFYRGLDLHELDMTAALSAPDPIAADPPLHASYEDRPGAPDRWMASLTDAETEHHVAAWARALARAGAREADVLHLHHLTPINAAAERVAPGVPVVGHLHGTELEMLEELAPEHPWRVRLSSWAARCERLVVLSDSQVERAERLLGIDPARCVRIANGFDPEAFVRHLVTGADRAAFWRETLGVGLGADVPVLLYVGRFTKVKRVPLLIEAHQRARRVTGVRAPLILVGGFPGEWEGEHPADAIARLGAEDVHLAGWHTHEALPALLNAADAVVLPSVREQFGQVLVEGMACGLPAVAVDAHGPAEIVEDGVTGWLVPPDDLGALAGALAEVLTDGRERARRGAAAMTAARGRYAWPALAVEVAQVYGSVVGDPVRAPLVDGGGVTRA